MSNPVPSPATSGAAAAVWRELRRVREALLPARYLVPDRQAGEHAEVVRGARTRQDRVGKAGAIGGNIRG